MSKKSKARQALIWLVESMAKLFLFASFAFVALSESINTDDSR